MSNAPYKVERYRINEHSSIKDVIEGRLTDGRYFAVLNHRQIGIADSRIHAFNSAFHAENDEYVRLVSDPSHYYGWKCIAVDNMQEVFGVLDFSDACPLHNLVHEYQNESTNYRTRYALAEYRDGVYWEVPDRRSKHKARNYYESVPDVARHTRTFDRIWDAERAALAYNKFRVRKGEALAGSVAGL